MSVAGTVGFPLISISGPVEASSVNRRPVVRAGFPLISISGPVEARTADIGTLTPAWDSFR